MTLTTTPLRDAADRLIAAAAAPRQCDPVRDILGNSDIAYAVQRLLTEHSLLVGGQEDMIGDSRSICSLRPAAPKTPRLGDEPPTSSAIP
jgi:hypothetical protein